MTESRPDGWTRDDKLHMAIVHELAIPSDLTWAEVRRTVYPGKTLEQIWATLWDPVPDVDKYLVDRGLMP